MRNFLFSFFLLLSANAFAFSGASPGVIPDRLSIFTFEQPPLFNGEVIQRVHIHPGQIGFTHHSILVLIDGHWFATSAIFADENGLFIQVRNQELCCPFSLACTNFQCGRSIHPNIHGRCTSCNTIVIHTIPH